MADFLLEIGCEEIPARMLDSASAELFTRVANLVKRERLGPPRQMEGHWTPRRLSVIFHGISRKQSDLQEQVMGPATKVAFKDGQPGPAAHAFAKKVGLELDQIQRISTPKGEYLAANVVKRGRNAAEVLGELLPKEIAGIYWPKSMYWREGAPERFVRPVRWIVAMLDSAVVSLEFGGISSGSVTQGHRILSHGATHIESASAYKTTLANAKVVVDPHTREERIRKALDAAIRTIPGDARWREDKALLETVVNLTEWPAVILGSFDREYLSLPEEVLVTVMRDHQKYFAVEDAGGKLAPHFLAVLNTDSDPDGIIRHGNERVLRARFNDARFFWDVDQKIPLKQRVDMLKAVTFQKELGSYHDKSLRVRQLTNHIVEELGSGTEINEPALSDAASVAKTDLTTELVKEFTELQGIVGGRYARAQGLDPATADAIYDQYKPESMDDAVPRTIEGAVLSLADKADSIAGMFALGFQPTSSKDPFALRRQANGIVKILAEHKLPLSVTHLMERARAAYKGSEAEKKFKDKKYKEEVAGFFRERIEFYLREAELEYDTVNAVLAAAGDNVPDVVARAKAVSQARKSEDFEHIAAAFKRVKNILRQAEEKKFKIAAKLEPARMQDETAFKLAGESVAIGAAVEQHRQEKNYEQALKVMATLRPHVDAFFDKVMVMVEDEKVRSHRLAMLRDLLANFSTIADFSEIVTEGKSS